MDVASKTRNQDDTDTLASDTIDSDKGSPKDDGGSALKDMAGQAQQTTNQLLVQGQQQAKSWTGQQKDQVAQAIDGVAQALRQTGDQLRTQNQDLVADYADRAAQQIEQVTTYLRDNDMDHLIRDAEYFAVRQPALFLGGAFLLGVLGARFLKSSSQQANVLD